MKKFSSKVIYGVCSGSEGYGLKLFDLEDIIKNKKIKSTMLKSIQPGYNGSLQYCSNNRRLGLLESFTRILVFPELHINFIKPFGILNEGNLCHKVDQDKYMVLTKDNMLYTWSLVTGKQLSVKHLPEHQNYSKYRIYNESYNVKMRSRVLLYSEYNETVDPEKLLELF